MARWYDADAKAMLPEVVDSTRPETTIIQAIANRDCLVPIFKRRG